MKTLNEVIKALEELGDFVAECNYCSAEYCNKSYEFDKCYSGEALHYLKAFRDAKNTLEREKDRYREAVKNCEEAENKYKMLSGKLEGFPTADVRKNLRY